MKREDNIVFIKQKAGRMPRLAAALLFAYGVCGNGFSANSIF
jgi:hypothetical protein